MWVGTDRGVHVSGEIDFRNDLDSLYGSVGDDLTNVLICVIAPGGILGSACDHLCAFIGIDIVVPIESFSWKGGAYAGELGVVGNVDSPSRIIGEMPVKTVKTIAGEQSEDLVDHLGWPEGSGRIEHEPAPCECWCALAVMWDY